MVALSHKYVESTLMLSSIKFKTRNVNHRYTSILTHTASPDAKWINAASHSSAARF
jgi:hypothetical protein